MDHDTPTHGGARKGAGRKPKPDQTQVNFRMDKGHLADLRAKQAGEPLGKFLVKRLKLKRP